MTNSLPVILEEIFLVKAHLLSRTIYLWYYHKGSYRMTNNYIDSVL